MVGTLSINQKNKKLIECKEFAINKNGLCLSTEYINNKTKMLWQCSCGYQWEANFNNIKCGYWCSPCGYRKNGLKSKTDINIIKEYAINKNGLLLSTEYENANKNLLWQCKEGHQWKATWASVKNKNHWCPYCVGLIKPDIKILQQYAINKEGLLLSTEYTNNHTKLLWQCSEGHQWEAVWHSIKDQNSWCPNCASFKTEKLCREFLEQKLGFDFNKTRIYYDINNNYKFFELDGYNKEHQIAFEYHGIQHYEFLNMYHKTLKDFEAQKLRDDLKEQYCAENDIKLIIIPYTESKNLERYINSIL